MKKLKQIWHEIIERWFLLTFFAERMERERLQVLAELVKRKDTLWKNIPTKSRTLKEILKQKPIKIQEVLNQVKEKENGYTKKKETESERN